VTQKRPHRAIRYARDLPVQGLAVLLQEVVDQQRDVLPPVPEWRQFQLDHVQPVQEVFTELAARDQLFEFLVRGGDDPHVDRPRTRVAHRHHHPLLHDPQDRTLDTRRQHRDFVQKESPAVGRLEEADLVARRPRKRPAPVPEQLGFHERQGYRPGVDRHERLVPRHAVIVDRPGEQFLARAGLADDEHVALDGGEFADHLEQARHGRRVPD
jgi:hypothetical protein